MSKVLGIDPKNKGMPTAVYGDGVLCDLKIWSLGDFFEMVRANWSRPDLIVIEDVQANKAIYTRNDVGGRKVAQQIAQRVGMNKQMQTVVMDIAEHYGVPVIAVKPTAANWADDKARFEAATGWTKQSNRDTRSAAYFGWLHRHKKADK